MHERALRRGGLGFNRISGRMQNRQGVGTKGRSPGRGDCPSLGERCQAELVRTWSGRGWSLNEEQAGFAHG